MVCATSRIQSNSSPSLCTSRKSFRREVALSHKLFLLQGYILRHSPHGTLLLVLTLRLKEDRSQQHTTWDIKITISYSSKLSAMGKIFLGPVEAL